MAATAPRVCTWYIRHVDLFNGLTPREADGLALALGPRQFVAGEVIIDRSTRPEVVYVVRNGTVRLFHQEPEGREQLVERLEAGQLFGVSALLTTDVGGLTAQAETDAEVCVVEGRRFVEAVSNWPEAMLGLALRLGVRVRKSEQVLGRMTATGSRARLAGVLQRLARDGSEVHPGGGLRLRGVPRHAQLAEEVGATRETVTRMLARLERDGYIRRFGRQIVIPDLERLVEDFDLAPEGAP